MVVVGLELWFSDIALEVNRAAIRENRMMCGFMETGMRDVWNGSDGAGLAFALHERSCFNMGAPTGAADGSVSRALRW